MQQRHILCHWSRFDKKSRVSVAKKPFERLCVNERTNERRKGETRERKGREKGAEEADDPEVVQPAERETVQKRARIMNILKSHKALSAGFHSRRFFNPCTSGTTSTSAVLSLSYSFLARSHASFSRDHLPLVSFPLPLSLFRGSYHQPSCLCRLRADQSMRDFCVGTTD